MKQIKKIKTTLFDGSEARFSLSVEGHFVKEKQDGSSSNLAYISDNGTAIINPNIYLVFAYKGDTFEESKAIFTSFPQLYKFRNNMKWIRDALNAPDSFVMVENALTVSPNYTSPYVISNIGMSQNWISFSLTVIGNADGTTTKGVKIQYSGCAFASVLTEDEFFTVAEIIDSVNLEAYKFEMSAFVIMNNNTPSYQTYPANNNYANNNNANRTRYSAPPAVQTPPTAYRENSFRQMPRAAAPMTNEMPVMNTEPVQRASYPSNPPANVAPRASSAPSINMANVEAEAPSFQMSMMDINEDDIDSIFGVED